MAVAALVVGIGAVCLGFLVAFLGIIAGVVAIVLAVLARREYVANPQLPGRGMVTAGLVLGIVAIVISIAAIILTLLFFDWDAFFREMENALIP